MFCCWTWIYQLQLQHMLQSLQSQNVLNSKTHQFSNSEWNKHDICIVSSQRSSQSLPSRLVCLSCSVASFRSTTRLRNIRMFFGCCKGPLTLKNLCWRNGPSGTPQNIPATSSTVRLLVAGNSPKCPLDQTQSSKNDCPEYTRTISRSAVVGQWASNSPAKSPAEWHNKTRNCMWSTLRVNMIPGCWNFAIISIINIILS